MKRNILLNLLLLFSTWSFCQSTTACDRKTDSLELVKFYINFRGDSWFDHTNWISGNPINTWYGIKLNTEGCVDSIQLNNNNLSGNMYDLNFQNLRSLSLQSNQIKKSVPNFSKLPILSKLDLAQNQLTGQIPNFSTLPELTFINLSYNQFNGSIPDFNKLNKLEFMLIASNQLSGQIPDFTNLSQLKDIDLAFNILTGEIPNFSKLPSLETIIVHGNQLSGRIPDFNKIPKLTHLLAAYNQFSGAIPDFSNLPNMYQLSLAVNQFTGSIPDFSNMPNLGIIYLSYNKLTGEIPNFTKIQNILVINFAYNKLSGIIPNFTKINYLIWLVLSGNELSGVIPDYRFRFPGLLDLELADNQLSGPIPNYSNFNSFYIWNNKFTFSDILNSNNLGNMGFYYSPQKPFYKDTVIRITKNIPLTIDLRLDATLNNNIYSWYKDSLAWTPPVGNNINSNKLNFTNPQSIDAGRYNTEVRNNQATSLILNSHTISLRVCDEQKDSIELVQLYNGTAGANWYNKTNWLQPGQKIKNWYGVSTDKFGCVQKLDLSNNNLSGTLPALNMNTLDTLILNKNQLTGAIPEMKIPFIRVLDLGHNSFVGNFPNNLINWYDLQGLDLSFNGINGAVPPDLGDLCELTTLRLNNNNIKGELPEQLTMLVNLQKGKVDFSNNQIDSLKNKLIWFCPFGDSILQINPSYDRFLGICNIQCSGNELNSLKDFPWIIDTVNNLNCMQANCALSIAQAGFVEVRGVKVFFTLSRCYTSLGPPPDFTDIVRFYDCGGHLIEIATNHAADFNTNFGAITKEDFDSLKYDIRWQCGDSLTLITNTEEDTDPIQNQKKLSEDVFTLKCFPNPANVILNCIAGEKLILGSLQILDLLGKNYNIKLKVVNEQLHFDVSNLPVGLYFISIQGMHGNYLGKVIVANN